MPLPSLHAVVWMMEMQSSRTRRGHVVVAESYRPAIERSITSSSGLSLAQVHATEITMYLHNVHRYLSHQLYISSGLNSSAVREVSRALRSCTKAKPFHYICHTVESGHTHTVIEYVR